MAIPPDPAGPLSEAAAAKGPLSRPCGEPEAFYSFTAFNKDVSPHYAMGKVNL